MKYAVTFQQKFNREPHPFHEDIDGNAFVVIEARDDQIASELSWQMFGSNWSMLYPYDDDFEQQIDDYALHEVEL